MVYVSLAQKNPENMSEVSLESYPPVFRQQTAGTHKHDLVDDTAREIQDLDPIPVIDLQSLDSDNKLEEACRDWGLFRLVNHGIPSTLLSQLQDHARELFSLSFEAKNTMFPCPVSYFWGTPALTSSGAALSRGALDVNWLEGLNVPLGQLSRFETEDPMLDAFRLLVEEYGRNLTSIATTLFEAMVRNLNLDPEQSKGYLSESTGILRVYRYPQCSTTSETWGLAVHTDSSVLSILNQDLVGGLEVLKDDKWLHVKPISDTLIVNLGDMMQAASNDEYKSVKHRVKVNKSKERFSICYFGFPAEDSVIRSSNYKPFTYSDFQARVQQDLKTLGFKVGLERFKLAQDD